MAAPTKHSAFWDVRPFRFVKFAEVSKEPSYATFEGAEGYNRFFQKLVNVHQTARSHIQKDIILEE
jgi:hypothetical protein